MQVALRPLDTADAPLLRHYLYLALFVPDGAPPHPPEVVDTPELARYVVDWVRPGDRGVLAVEPQSGHDVGAIWLRLWSPGNTGYGFIDHSTPELSMAVRPGWRGQGIGTKLMRRLLVEADLQHPAVSLSVSIANPAIRLYRRSGFETFAALDGSATMRRMRPERLV